MRIWLVYFDFGVNKGIFQSLSKQCTKLFFAMQICPTKPIYSYTGGRSVACLAPWHAYVRGRAEEDHPRGGGLLWKPNWHELDTEGLLAWCGIHTCDATTQLGDRSARVPMKVVTSCDKLRGGACIPWIRRLPNGTSQIIAMR